MGERLLNILCIISPLDPEAIKTKTNTIRSELSWSGGARNLAMGPNRAQGAGQPETPNTTDYREKGRGEEQAQGGGEC